MDWTAAVANPQALASLPAGIGALPVDLHEVILHRDGPSVRLSFDLAVVPDVLPARWDEDVNRTQVRLACFGVQTFALTGFTTTLSGQLSARPIDNGWMVTFAAGEVVLTLRTSLVRVESLSGYRNAGDDE